ncbi:thioredoxin [Anaeromyxobacter dehalogenans]|uniref:Thioredoxin n=1 Tax=Anaeromyxobacter dehalogenans (strain 2CP-C) TaxID=290397 RepID=Q2IJZ4_ANADE|nr:thioredoxin [Anaeromyxobacter dehalogenans]ABC81971.1 thioredoxin [Anaeromyxobacter dehalogenans 2CP-C]
MAAVMEIGDAEFEREVLAAPEPVLVEFTAAWCAPCKALAPTLEALASGYRGRVKVAALDVERHPATAERYGIRSMPTLLFFMGGKVARQLVGAVPRARLEDAVRELLPG